MKRYHVLGLALVAVCAMGVLSAAASAATFLLAEWLESGNPVTATLLAEILGSELSLSETLDGIHINALCSGSLDGFIGPNGADEITEALSLAGVSAGAPLSGTGILCTNSENCGEPLAWAVELPWLTLLVLMEDGSETFFADLLTSEKSGGKVGYEVECMSLGISDTCTVTEGAAKVENTAEGVNSEFSDSFTELAGLKLANCELAGTEEGLVEGLGIAGVSGVTLTASE